MWEPRAVISQETGRTDARTGRAWRGSALTRGRGASRSRHHRRAPGGKGPVVDRTLPDSTHSERQCRRALHGARRGLATSVSDGSPTTVGFRLNPAPLWDLDFDVGAAELRLDLVPYRIRELTVDCGASSVKLTLGDRAEWTRVRIDAGASSVRLQVPEHCGCRVETDAGLSSKRLPEFSRVADGVYETETLQRASAADPGHPRCRSVLHSGRPIHDGRSGLSDGDLEPNTRSRSGCRRSCSST